MKKKTHLYVFLALQIIAIIAALVPFVMASRYAYPWTDDFGYGAYAHLAFRSTGSVFKAIGAAWQRTVEAYITWQGTYTSCFLMALQPGVFSNKLYHLTGIFMLATMFLSYYIFFHCVLRKTFKASTVLTWCLYLLTVFLSIEGVDGKAEGFTWFNSAVHYTFGHALLMAFLGLTFSYMMDNAEKKSLLPCILISILGFLTAGVNNITVFGGLLTLLIFLVCAFLYLTIWGQKNYRRPLRILPMTIVYMIGTVINFAAVGNKKRMVVATEHTNSVFTTIKNAFVLGFAFIQRHFSLVTVAFILISVVLIWYALAQEKILESIDFKFPLPGLVTLISFCLISALYAPSTYVTDIPDGTIAYIEANLGVLRIANCVYFTFILLLLLNVFYYCGWLYKKNFAFHNSVAGTAIVCVALVVAAITCKFQIDEHPNAYLTSSSIHCLKNGTAQYYGYQMALNFQALESDESIVTVSPLGVDPDVLYPHDASDWKEGVRPYYGKDAVEYDHEPYDF